VELKSKRWNLEENKKNERRFHDRLVYKKSQAQFVSSQTNIIVEIHLVNQTLNNHCEQTKNVRHLKKGCFEN